MPIIQFNLLEGRTVEQKRELARRVTETVTEVLGVKPEMVRILIHQVTGDDFSVGGVTATERAAAAAAATAVPEAIPVGPPDGTVEAFHQLVAEEGNAASKAPSVLSRAA